MVKTMALAAATDDRALLTMMEEVARDAMFRSEVRRLQRHGVDFTEHYCECCAYSRHSQSTKTVHQNSSLVLNRAGSLPPNAAEQMCRTSTTSSATTWCSQSATCTR